MSFCRRIKTLEEFAFGNEVFEDVVKLFVNVNINVLNSNNIEMKGGGYYVQKGASYCKMYNSSALFSESHGQVLDDLAER